MSALPPEFPMQPTLDKLIERFGERIEMISETVSRGELSYRVDVTLRPPAIPRAAPQ